MTLLITLRLLKLGRPLKLWLAFATVVTLLTRLPFGAVLTILTVLTILSFRTLRLRKA